MGDHFPPKLEDRPLLEESRINLPMCREGYGDPGIPTPRGLSPGNARRFTSAASLLP